ncbi:hypothetical protein NQ318_022188 [Aromia moschata]|uniref:deoxyhypusine synthase n=1 Tax=Aromia moschata TaxID=1265417 RepID=A0AAV8Z6F3_9CUCU|nr:hypothetical protein NQ318_022188 [Aromia moschata]
MAGASTSGLNDTVLKKTNDISLLKEKVTGYDWNQGLDYNKLLNSYVHTGFQATNFGLAVNEINKMIECRKLPIPKEKYIDDEDEFTAVKNNFQNNMIDCIVTTAGGIEEDFIKCLAPTFLGDFTLEGKMLRERGINRIGNLLVPNDNYCSFEHWIMPILDEMLKEQKMGKLIERLGKEINCEDSIYYWTAKNKIPVFCPALTDGSIGDMMFLHSFRNPGLVLDIISDLRRLNLMAMKAVNTGMIILGGGVIKHHICNANLMRNGAEFTVYVNTASEFDGSDSGARPDEAKSWGKIKSDATPVKIYADASLVFPLLVAQTFAKNLRKNKVKFNN